MKMALKNSYLYHVTARALLLARKASELLKSRIGTPSLFQLQGYTRFDDSYFIGRKDASCHSAQLIELLDSIDSGHLQNDESFPASFAGDTYSYEFISENAFYNNKLGPRLRLTYNVNTFETWPELARQIILSEKYRTMIRDQYGTLTGVYKCYIEKTFLNGTEPEWHVDSISQIGRLLFFLTDVDENNAPMEYIVKSNQDAHSDYHAIKLKHLKSAESWTPHKGIRPASAVRQLTGKAGESYFFDARGVHRSTIARTRPRYAMMISFTPKTFSNWYFDLNRGAWPSGTRDLGLLTQS